MVEKIPQHVHLKNCDSFMIILLSHGNEQVETGPVLICSDSLLTDYMKKVRFMLWESGCLVYSTR